MPPVASVFRPPLTCEARCLAMTAKGAICVQNHASAQSISLLTMDPGVGVLFHYSQDSPARQKHLLLHVADRPDGNVTIAYSTEGHLVGYLCFAPPAPKERWGGSEFPFVTELGLIEVSRYWRGIGLAERLMLAAFEDGGFEDKIVIANAYAWHWDLVASGLSKWQYRAMMQRLLARRGFVELATDEENVAFDPANIFAVRTGSRVPSDQRAKFKQSLFLQ